MDSFRDPKFIRYKSLLEGSSLCQNVLTTCQCLKGNMFKNNHSVIAKPVSHNLAELANKSREQANSNAMMMYITNTFYFNHVTMQYLANEMLVSDETKVVQKYYDILNRNFTTHPPCASYMEKEYEQLFLTKCNNYFTGMTLWNYLIQCFDHITSGSVTYGNNKARDLAFKRCLSFCVTVLQMNYEVAKHCKTTAIIMKCLKYDPERKTRMSEINKTLYILFNSVYDFQMPICNLLILIDRMTSDT